MASEEMTSAHMKLTELKKFNLQKSMLSLLVNWKDLDQHLDSTHQCLDDKINRLDSKENQLFAIQESLAENNKEMDLLRISIGDRVKLVERKEKDLQEFQQQLMSDFSLKQQNLNAMEESLKERTKDVEMKEEVLQVFHHQLMNDFSLKQQNLNSMEESLNERIKDAEMKEDALKVFQHQLANDFSLKQQNLNSMEESLKERIKEVEMREEALGRRLSEIESRSREVRSKESIFSPKNIIDVKLAKSLRLSSDPAKSFLDAMKEGFYVWDTEFPKIITWRNRILFLQQLIVLSPEIETPVKLEALEIASEWEAKIRENANDNSWKAKLREKIDGPWAALGFLHLLAAYKLTSDFKVEKLLNVVERVATHEQTPGLLRLIGLEEKVPVLIKTLIEKEQRLVAIRYIFEFKLVDLFPPVPLLKSHLSYSEAIADKIRDEEPNSPTAQARARELELDSLIDVVKCLMDNRLGPQYSPENIQAHIKKSQADYNMIRSFQNIDL